jgi:hypothetical protein
MLNEPVDVDDWGHGYTPGAFAADQPPAPFVYTSNSGAGRFTDAAPIIANVLPPITGPPPTATAV